MLNFKPKMLLNLLKFHFIFFVLCRWKRNCVHHRTGHGICQMSEHLVLPLKNICNQCEYERYEIVPAGIGTLTLVVGVIQCKRYAYTSFLVVYVHITYFFFIFGELYAIKLQETLILFVLFIFFHFQKRIFKYHYSAFVLKKNL